MAKRFKTRPSITVTGAASVPAAVVRSFRDDPSLAWGAATKAVAQAAAPKPNPFASNSAPKVAKKNVPIGVTMWAMANKVNPDVFQKEPLNTYINEGDGVDSWRQLSLELISLGRGDLYNNNGAAQLEFIQLVASDKEAETQQAKEEFGDFDEKTPVPEIIKILTDEGFDVVHENTFSEDEFGSKKTDTHYILFNKELGVLVNFDTYGGRLNGGNIYLQLEGDNAYKIGGSGGFEKIDGKDYAARHFDIREGWHRLKAKCLKHGKFVPKWKPIERTCPDLTSWGDKRECERREKKSGIGGIRKSSLDYYCEKCKENLNLLPTWVRKQIGW
jgi:hypothetical protein